MQIDPDGLRPACPPAGAERRAIERETAFDAEQFEIVAVEFTGHYKKKARHLPRPSLQAAPFASVCETIHRPAAGLLARIAELETFVQAFAHESSSVPSM